MALRRDYKGNAAQTTLSADITASSTSIGIVSGTNWPTGGVGNFFIIIDRGLSSEEKVLCSARSGNTLTVASGGRGADDTTAAAHLSGAVVEHGMTKTDADEANDHVADTTNDDHTQYLNNARHDVEARHTFGAALGTAQTPVDISGVAAAAGAGANPANEAHIHMLSPPACRVTKSAVQSIGDATFTTLTWNTESYDTDTMHDTVTNNDRITFNTAGIYIVTFNGEMAGANDYANVSCRLVIGGVTVVPGMTVGSSPIAAGTGVFVSAHTQRKFTAGQFITAQVYQDNTAPASRDFQTNGEFSAVWVGDGV